MNINRVTYWNFYCRNKQAWCSRSHVYANSLPYYYALQLNTVFAINCCFFLLVNHCKKYNILEFNNSFKCLLSLVCKVCVWAPTTELAITFFFACIGKKIVLFNRITEFQSINLLFWWLHNTQTTMLYIRNYFLSQSPDHHCFTLKF